MVALYSQSSEFFLYSQWWSPHGSVLTPTLFLIFSNDLPDEILTSFIDIFVDDSTLYSSFSPLSNVATVFKQSSADLSSIVREVVRYIQIRRWS